MKVLILFILPVFMSCKKTETTKENDTVLVLKTVLSIPELASCFHINDGSDSTLRVLQNGKIGKETVFDLKDKKIEFAQAYPNNVRLIEITQLEFTDNKAQLTLEIDYEGVVMKAELEKNGEVWIVKNKSLVEQ